MTKTGTTVFFNFLTNKRSSTTGSSSADAVEVCDVMEPVGDERPLGLEYFNFISWKCAAYSFNTHTL